MTMKIHPPSFALDIVKGEKIAAQTSSLRHHSLAVLGLRELGEKKKQPLSQMAPLPKH